MNRKKVPDPRVRSDRDGVAFSIRDDVVEMKEGVRGVVDT